MVLTPTDTCDGCKRNLFDYGRKILKCPVCKARFCEQCVRDKGLKSPLDCPKCNEAARPDTH